MQRQTKLKRKLFTRAFSRVPAGDSPSPGVYPEDEALVDTGALAFIEGAIHTLATQGNRPALKRALYIYLRLRGAL